MARVAVIGEPIRVSGFALGGAQVYVAEDAAAALLAWRGLDPGVEVVILTAAAARHLAAVTSGPGEPLVVVMPA